MATGRLSQITRLPSGSVLVAVTDGLVDRRSRVRSDGVEQVRRALERILGDMPTDVLADRLLSAADRCGSSSGTPPQYPSALERSDVEHRTTSRAAGEPQRAPTQRFVVFTGAERCRRVLPSR
jgi:hypothetical protein